MRWRDSPLGRRLGVRLPIIQAPMAGGAATAAVTAAVSEAGGLGSVAGGLLSPDELRAAIRDVRALTDRPFAVNLFAPLLEPSLSRAAEWAQLTGAPSVPSPPASPSFADQLDVVVAAGGIMDGRGVAAAVALGAQAVAMGTAFLGCAEAGTSEPYRAALSSDTTVTAVLTGRHGRVVRTPLVDRLAASGLRPPDFPLPLVLAPENPVYAGQAGGLARFVPAGELVRTVGQETNDVLGRLVGDGESQIR